MSYQEVITKTRHDITKLRLKYPNKIPIIIKYEDRVIKMLSDKENTISTILLILREKIKLNNSEAIFLFHQDSKGNVSCPSMNTEINELKEDMIAFTLMKENVFGDEDDKKKNNMWTLVENLNHLKSWEKINP